MLLEIIFMKFILLILNIFDKETPTAAEESLRGVPRARLLFQCLATTLVRPLLLGSLLVFDGLGHGGHFGLAHVLRVRVGWCDGSAHPRHLEIEWCYKLSGAAVRPIITTPPRFFEMFTKPSVLQSGPRGWGREFIISATSPIWAAFPLDLSSSVPSPGIWSRNRRTVPVGRENPTTKRNAFF